MSKSKRQIKTKTLAKVQKKSWYPIIAPDLFNKQFLGKSLVGEPEQLMHKTIATNAMNVTGDMKKQHITITFKVDGIHEGQGTCSVDAYEVNPAYIKRMVRRNKNKLDLSFRAHTKDNVWIRMKPTLLTKNKATGSVCSALHKKTEEFLIKYLRTLTFEEIIHDLLLNKLQNILRAEVKKIYPVKIAEIRMLEREPKPEAKRKPKEEKEEQSATAA